MLHKVAIIRSSFKAKIPNDNKYNHKYLDEFPKYNLSGLIWIIPGHSGSTYWRKKNSEKRDISQKLNPI